MANSRYLTAQICPNGHVVTSSLEWGVMNSPHCPACGQSTVTKCQCGAPIRGYYYTEGSLGGGKDYNPPSFCFACGAAFPWTALRLDAARELINELEELTVDEREALSGTLSDLVSDTPRSEVAALRFKKLAAKVGAEAAGALRSILVDVLSDVAKKSIIGL